MGWLRPLRDFPVDYGTPNQRTPQFPQDADTVEGGDKRICPNCGLKLSKDIAICPNDGTVLVNNADLDGKLSNQYEFLSEIGSGGMGVIYKARHVALNQIVAIKMLHNNRLDEISIRRFQQEAKAVTALDHPSIVRVRDFGVTDSGQPHMVLDFIEGDTLSKAIEKTAGLPLAESLDIFIQACDALEHAHIRGVLHRDLKPSNIMLVPRSSGALVKIVDFGIAKINDPDHESAVLNLTQTGEVFGSPLYMSPEQASGTKLDSRSDVYSFGCVMYETLTGAPPFVGGSSIETIFRQLNDQAPTLREGSLGKEFPPEIEFIVAKALEKKPEDRFQSMAELKGKLLNLKLGKDSDRPSQNAQAAVIDKKRYEIKALLFALVVLVFLAATSGYFVVTTSANKTPVKTEAEVIDETSKVKQIILKDGDSEQIDLNNLKVTDKMLELFAVPTKPTSVILSNTLVVGPGLANLIHLPLKNLSLSGSPTTDRGLEEIKHMESLEKLNLSRTAISDRGLLELKSLQNLQELDLSEDPIGLNACSMIKFWPHLAVLIANKTAINSDNAFTDLARSESLKTLSLIDSQTRDVDVRALAQGHFENLILDGAAIDDPGLNLLVPMKSLKTLSLKRCKLTPQALEHFKAARPDITMITDN